MSGRGRGKGRKQPAAEVVKVAGASSAHDWTLLAHPLFLDQLERLTAKVEAEDALGVGTSPARNLLGHVLDLVFESIPQNPASPAFRHGGALAGGNRQWFRGKTGNGRFRLFFRYHGGEKIIVYAWLNDEQSLRTTGARTDAYAVFATMLEGGNPPTDWAALRGAASSKQALARLATAATKRARRHAP